MLGLGSSRYFYETNPLHISLVSVSRDTAHLTAHPDLHCARSLFYLLFIDTFEEGWSVVYDCDKRSVAHSLGQVKHRCGFDSIRANFEIYPGEETILERSSRFRADMKLCKEKQAISENRQPTSESYSP